MATWEPFLYSNSQLWLPQLEVLQFDSRLNQPPQADIFIAGKDWKQRSTSTYLMGCETTASGLQGYLRMVEGVCALKRGDVVNAERQLQRALEV
jgi:hypothetical protein